MALVLAGGAIPGPSLRCDDVVTLSSQGPFGAREDLHYGWGESLKAPQVKSFGGRTGIR